MKTNIPLLIIDPQNDFCDLPAEWLSSERACRSISLDGDGIGFEP
ncbi:MAG: hypothetical protein ACRERX_16720 [Pseudomonas sp.]